MTQDKWDKSIIELQKMQRWVAETGRFIMSVSLSATQVRVCIVAHEQQEQRFFIYRHTEDSTATLVMQRIGNYIDSMEKWLGLKN